VDSEAAVNHRPRLCDFIRDHRGEILVEWERLVRVQSPAREVSDAALIDHLPALLDRIADVVATAKSGASLRDLPDLHAVSRLDLGFDLRALVNEFTLLRACVLTLYENAAGHVGTLQEIERFNACLDDAIARSVARYATVRGRTLLALDRLSEAALGGDDLDKFLSRLVRVVVETVDAVDLAAIFLREDDALHVRAAVGMVQEHPQLALRVGEGFAGAVAAERRPIELRDGGRTSTIELRGLPPDTKVLYGVPLLHGEHLVGVAYMGSRSAYEFSPEDTVLLRAMATRATAFIVQARLLRAEQAERARADAGRELLRDSEARYRALFNAIDEGFCIVEVGFDEAGKAIDYRFLEVNAAFERQTGLANATGRWMRELAPAHEEHWFEIYGRVAVAGEPIRFENRAEALGRWYDVFAFRVGPPECRRVAVLFNDITARKHAEEALREADQRKTDFLATLGHELRNPLAPIRNSIYLLERVPPDGPQALRAKEVVRRQTEHLTRLVDDLLDVTRISRGRIELRREVVDLRNVVRRTCEDMKILFDQAAIDLRVDFPASPVLADVDATRIAQVVGNLLHNANKFTPAEGVVTVALRNREAMAEIEVSDTGIGMEPRDVPRMFEPFAQERRDPTRSEGLGLGLPLAKALVELHGGTLGAHSAGPGKGARFTVRLPLAPALRRPTVTPAREGTGRAAGRVILVIDDNVDSGRTLADVLELGGHEVHLARDGSSGIALARELKPDVVICDVGLPDVDGYEIARTLRADGSLASTRLVALSGYAQPEDKERAREAGFDAHLSKPAPLDELAALLA
jgi:PAS domain S-box-containing protein